MNVLISFRNYAYGLLITLILSTGTAVIAQLGERKTEDLKVSGSIPDCGTFLLKTEVFNYFRSSLSIKQMRVSLVHVNGDGCAGNNSRLSLSSYVSAQNSNYIEVRQKQI